MEAQSLKGKRFTFPLTKAIVSAGKGSRQFMEKLENLRLRSPLNSVHMFSSSVISSWKITVKRGNLSRPISVMSRVSCGHETLLGLARPAFIELSSFSARSGPLTCSSLTLGWPSLEIACSDAHLRALQGCFPTCLLCPSSQLLGVRRGGICGCGMWETTAFCPDQLFLAISCPPCLFPGQYARPSLLARTWNMLCT